MFTPISTNYGQVQSSAFLPPDSKRPSSSPPEHSSGRSARQEASNLFLKIKPDHLQHIVIGENNYNTGRDAAMRCITNNSGGLSFLTQERAHLSRPSFEGLLEQGQKKKGLVEEHRVVLSHLRLQEDDLSRTHLMSQDAWNNVHQAKEETKTATASASTDVQWDEVMKCWEKASELTLMAQEADKNVERVEVILAATRKKSGAMAISIEDSSSTFIQAPSVYDTLATPAPSQDHARSLTTTTSHIPAGSLRNEPRTAASSDQPPTKFDPSTNNQNAIQEAALVKKFRYDRTAKGVTYEESVPARERTDMV